MSAGNVMDDAGWTLTATDALARQLRQDKNLALSRQSQGVWEAPQIAAMARWCIDIWSASWPGSQLLSATQELVLWREAVERDPACSSLLAPQAAAREARRADQILRRYGIDPEQGPLWLEEHQAFRRWRKHVLKRLAEHDWLTAADIPLACVRLISAGKFKVPLQIRLAGFFEPPCPAEQAVIDALAARGTEIIWDALPERQVTRGFVQLPEQQDQLRHVAAAVRQALARARDEDAPHIVIAVPDIGASRDALERVLRELVAPWSLTGDSAVPWRWIKGPRLSEQPHVDALLDVLQLQPEGNAPDLISRVLLSNVLWTPAERRQTSRADERLRDRGAPRIRLQRVAELLEPPLRDRFEYLLQTFSKAPSRALPSQWAEVFRERLESLGWPGAQSPDSLSYQSIQAARGLLDRLGTLDAQLGAVPALTARQWLQELAAGTSFSPRAEYFQPVLIADLEDAASLPCDQLYVLDASAAQLPPPARATPLLPLDWMRAAGVAEASPEQWLVRTQRQLNWLLNRCAAQVEVCVPAVDARGAELLPSTLFADPAKWEPVVVAEQLSALEKVLGNSASHCVWPADDPVPPVSDAERESLSPGADLIKHWFESPFFAFCTARLGIAPLPVPPRGISGQTQGTALHDVLCDFWGEVSGSEALAALDAQEINQRLSRLVDVHLHKNLPEADYGVVVIRLERERMMDVLQQWIDHERRRLDAFVVHARECQAKPMIAGLSLSLRLDRVDLVHTPFGPRWLVIDYKTGSQADPKGWGVEKFNEPQLPLYASHAALDVVGVPAVDGICFGHLKEGHPALSAQSNWRKCLIEEPAAQTAHEWSDMINLWRDAIERAARDFLAGHAGLDLDKIPAHSFNKHLLALTGRSVEEEDAE